MTGSIADRFLQDPPEFPGRLGIKGDLARPDLEGDRVAFARGSSEPLQERCGRLVRVGLLANTVDNQPGRLAGVESNLAL
ncbi:hypothetical protein [Thioclava atlantica]|uniref:hypothetical protein n=1 Tax=Thioclava atlantica TaxID=1317124 RepID=UPI00057178F3|nr:hypothetical protein [Thioclava atlantica]